MKQGFNINDYVEFVLTQRGADQLNQHHTELNEILYNRTRLSKYMERLNSPDVYKEGDTYRNQLWTVMQIFGGDNTKLGLETFCKEATISFNVKELVNE